LIALLLLALAAAPSLESAADAVAAQALGPEPHGGLTIAVARGGRMVLAKGYGEADAKRHVAAAGDTVYPICSISKNFAAAAILKLAEEGKVDLGTPIARFFPKDPAGAQTVTVRQLLNHTSGLGSYNDDPRWEQIGARALAYNEVVDMISAAVKTPPGKTWGYSNSAFYLAGLLVEKISGRGYWDFLETEFFRPLAMRRSRACATRSDEPRARGYRATEGRLEDAEKESWENPYAGGGLCSTARDLLTWQAALDSGKALTPASVREMRSPTRLPAGVVFDYGLGTRLGSLEGHPVLGHTGGGQGFSTVLLRFPSDDLTIVVLKNATAGPNARIVAARLARRLLDLPPFSYRDLPVPEDVSKALSGNWSGDYGPFRLETMNGKLVVRVGDGAPPIPISYQGDSVFAAGEEDLVRSPIENGHADWGFDYVGGLFDSPVHRVGR
jgi:D-alanyl-D-alanine carboxypeptidase